MPQAAGWLQRCNQLPTRGRGRRERPAVVGQAMTGVMRLSVPEERRSGAEASEFGLLAGFVWGQLAARFLLAKRRTGSSHPSTRGAGSSEGDGAARQRPMRARAQASQLRPPSAFPGAQAVQPPAAPSPPASCSPRRLPFSPPPSSNTPPRRARSPPFDRRSTPRRLCTGSAQKQERTARDPANAD